MTIRTYNWHRYTLAESYERIKDGEEPWVAIGDFLDHWRLSAPADRLMLVKDSPSETHTAELKCWAALCAGIVEALCEQENVLPGWTMDKQYILHEPWFLEARSEPLQRYQAETTPEVFKRRNVLGGDRLLERV